MGTYVYRIKKGNLKTATFNGEQVAIVASEYAYKQGSPIGSFSRNSAAAKRERMTELTDQRVFDAWNEKNFPKYVVHGGYEDGYTVFTGFTPNRAVYADHLTEKEGIRAVGFVKKVGRRITIVETFIDGPKTVLQPKSETDRTEMRRVVRERRTVVDGKVQIGYIVISEEPTGRMFGFFREAEAVNG